ILATAGESLALMQAVGPNLIWFHVLELGGAGGFAVISIVWSIGGFEVPRIMAWGRHTPVGFRLAL
ncbi:MAG: hypothetical protein L0K34_03385, partial [Ancrocorticia sp.]|nr:hypothetical protein [Ancrocorticia sp.]